METIFKILMSNPETILPLAKEYINKYKPVVYGLVQELENIYKDYANNPDHATTVAKVKKNQYDAYINVGFNEDQALALMINDNIQLMKNLKNTSNSLSSTSKNM